MCQFVMAGNITSISVQEVTSEDEAITPLEKIFNKEEMEVIHSSISPKTKVLMWAYWKSNR